jgi:hypothetical protein
MLKHNLSKCVHRLTYILAMADDMTDATSSADEAATRICEHKVQVALDYVSKLCGKPYKGWSDGETMCNVDDPFWTKAEAPPAISAIGSLCCVGIPNLMRRCIGKAVPGQSFKYQGGTYAWFSTLESLDLLEPFDIKSMYPVGSLLLRNYTDPEDQGHVAVVQAHNMCPVSNAYLSARVLHATFIRNVCIDDTIEMSHTWDQHKAYYTHVSRPENWLMKDL